jgi:hypothetical protein
MKMNTKNTKWQLRLYPRWWRDRYGDEFAALLDDLRDHPLSTLDILKGAMDVRLLARHGNPLRLGLAFGVPAALAIAVDVVYTNVIHPIHDDTTEVLVIYSAIFGVMFLAGLFAARRTQPPFGPALTAAATGAVIAVLTIATFVVVDNLFLGTVGSQPQKIHGLSESPFASMRLYVNFTLVVAAAILVPFLSACGFFLGGLGGLAGGMLRPALQRLR